MVLKKAFPIKFGSMVFYCINFNATFPIHHCGHHVWVLKGGLNNGSNNEKYTAIYWFGISERFDCYKCSELKNYKILILLKIIAVPTDGLELRINIENKVIFPATVEPVPTTYTIR